MRTLQLSSVVSRNLSRVMYICAHVFGLKDLIIMCVMSFNYLDRCIHEVLRLTGIQSALDADLQEW